MDLPLSFNKIRSMVRFCDNLKLFTICEKWEMTNKLFEQFKFFFNLYEKYMIVVVFYHQILFDLMISSN